jgi:hypothetical protein
MLGVDASQRLFAAHKFILATAPFSDLREVALPAVASRHIEFVNLGLIVY